MICGYSGEREIIQNMSDAGFSEAAIANFLEYLKQGRQNECLDLLQTQREKLLEEIHREQSDIEFLESIISENRSEKI